VGLVHEHEQVALGLEIGGELGFELSDEAGFRLVRDLLGDGALFLARSRDR
jgi:hypothetical protein